MFIRICCIVVHVIFMLVILTVVTFEWLISKHMVLEEVFSD